MSLRRMIVVAASFRVVVVARLSGILDHKTNLMLALPVCLLSLTAAAAAAAGFQLLIVLSECGRAREPEMNL